MTHEEEVELDWSEEWYRTELTNMGTAGRMRPAVT